MENAIGKITHYFSRLGVAVVRLEEELSIGEKLLIKGRITNFSQTVSSIQSEHKSLEKASAGMEIGMKTENPVEVGDIVYRIG